MRGSGVTEDSEEWSVVVSTKDSGEGMPRGSYRSPSGSNSGGL